MLHFKAIRIKLSYLWLPSFALLPYLHLTKVVFFIFLILSVHESAHMMVAMLCHYKVKEVTIYPFGLSATIPALGYGSLYKEVMIIAAGPLSQVIFPLLFSILMDVHWISKDFSSYLRMLNASILVFNLLPIYPLDGGRLVQVLFHCIFRYRSAQYGTCIASMLVLVLLFFSHCMQGLGAYVVQLFLFFQILICWKDIMRMQLSFYLYRYRHKSFLPIIMNKGNDLFRGRYNIMKHKQLWEEESTWLSRRFPHA